MISSIFSSTKTLEQLGEELGENDPTVLRSKLMESEFSDLVDVLRNPKYFPIPEINKLMTLFWRLVGNKITPVAMTDVPSVSFCAAQQKTTGRLQALILIPEKWWEMLRENPKMQMGGLVFAASQAKDYWNHKIVVDSKNVMPRAGSYEAELLHYFARTSQDFKPNEYQKKIMEAFSGFSACSSHYEGRDYDGQFPPFPVRSEDL